MQFVIPMLAVFLAFAAIHVCAQTSPATRLKRDDSAVLSGSTHPASPEGRRRRQAADPLTGSTLIVPTAGRRRRDVDMNPLSTVVPGRRRRDAETLPLSSTIMPGRRRRDLQSSTVPVGGVVGNVQRHERQADPMSTIRVRRQADITLTTKTMAKRDISGMLSSTPALHKRDVGSTVRS